MITIKEVLRLSALVVCMAGGVAEAQIKIEIPSYDLPAYTDLYGGPKDSLKRVTLSGMLSFPAAQSEKFPAVIIMHGSAGVSEHEASIAKQLNSLGIATLVVDWFGGRHVGNSSADQSKVSFPSTAVDLLMAYKALAANPKIDSNRIGAVGFSRGGTAEVMANSTTLADRWLGPGQSFAAFALYYAGCNRYQKPVKPMKAAILVLSGALDDLTPSAACEAYAADLKSAGVPVEVHIYPKSAHDFDEINGSRSFPQMQSAANCPFAIDETGVLTLPDGSKVKDSAGLMAYARKCVKVGTTYAGTAEEAAAAHTTFLSFMKTTLKVN
jgi:dienelactone hydrolase